MRTRLVLIFQFASKRILIFFYIFCWSRLVSYARWIVFLTRTRTGLCFLGPENFSAFFGENFFLLSIYTTLSSFISLQSKLRLHYQQTLAFPFGLSFLMPSIYLTFPHTVIHFTPDLLMLTTKTSCSWHYKRLKQKPIPGGPRIWEVVGQQLLILLSPFP